MEKIKIQDHEFEIISILKSGPNLLILEFPEQYDLLDIDKSSIEVYTNGDVKCALLVGYTTIYKVDGSKVFLSNDNSVYIEPEVLPIVEPHQLTEDEIKLQLENAKISKIIQTNDLLKQYLFLHPILYTDGLYYSVTNDKQNLLMGRLLSYQLELQAGIQNPELTWNSTGEICTSWTYENLIKLALTIKNYVEPLVKKQQLYEKEINSLNTIEEVNNMMIDYASII